MSDRIDMKPDVMALVFVTDVVVTYVFIWWLMLLSLLRLILFGRCYSQCWTLQLLQGHLAMADGIAIGTC